MQQRRRATGRRSKPKVTSSDIRRAIRTFDFVDFLEDHGINGRENAQGEYRGECPFCGGTSRDPFCVNSTSGLWFCHACPEKGGPVQLLCRVLDVGYDKAVEYLVDRYSAFERETDDDDYTEPTVPTISLPDEFRSLADTGESIVARPYLKYLQRSDRNVDAATIRKYNIGYCATGWYAGRVVVPVYHLGKVVSFVARAISKSADTKILTPPGNNQASYCFNLDHIWGAKEVIIMEGVFDVFTLPEMSVCTFGKKISPMQVSLLKKSGVESVTFCYDEDALDELQEFTEKYMLLLKAKLILLPKGKDPAKLGRTRMLELLPNAKNATIGGLRVS